MSVIVSKYRHEDLKGSEYPFHLSILLYLYYGAC